MVVDRQKFYFSNPYDNISCFLLETIANHMPGLNLQKNRVKRLDLKEVFKIEKKSNRRTGAALVRIFYML